MLEVIIQAYQQQLFHYCCHMFGNLQEAEDAVQDTFIKVFENIGKYQPGLSFTAWIYKIAYHHSLNVLRRKKLIQFLPFQEDTGIGHTHIQSCFEKNEFSEALQKALKKLSALDRSILILRILSEKNYDDLSLILSIKPATLRKKYERAVKRLKKDLQIKHGGVLYEEYAIDR